MSLMEVLESNFDCFDTFISIESNHQQVVISLTGLIQGVFPIDNWEIFLKLNPHFKFVLKE